MAPQAGQPSRDSLTGSVQTSTMRHSREHRAAKRRASTWVCAATTRTLKPLLTTPSGTTSANSPRAEAATGLPASPLLRRLQVIQVVGVSILCPGAVIPDGPQARHDLDVCLGSTPE